MLVIMSYNEPRFVWSTVQHRNIKSSSKYLIFLLLNEMTEMIIGSSEQLQINLLKLQLTIQIHVLKQTLFIWMNFKVSGHLLEIIYDSFMNWRA